MSVNFNIWILYLWTCSNLPSQTQNPCHRFHPFSLCKFFAPSSANVWNKLKKQNTVGNLDSVLIRNIFTHGVRLYIISPTRSCDLNHPLQAIKHWNEDVFLSDCQINIYLFIFSTVHVKTSLWIVQMHNSTCLLDIHLNVNFYSHLNFSFMFFLLLSSKWQKMIWKYKCTEETNEKIKSTLVHCVFQHWVADFQHTLESMSSE